MANNSKTDLLLAGGLAAFSVDLLVYPLDTLKTRYQSKDFQRLYYDQANKLNRAALFRGLYQGVGSIILVTIPSSGLFFTTYEGIKGSLRSVNRTPGDSKPLLPQPIIDGVASSIAELVACLVITPAEVIKQNAQMVQKDPSAHKRHTAWSLKNSPTIQTLMSFKNPSQVFRGYTALAARNLPFTAMQFPLYEHLKKDIKTRRQNKGIFSGSLLETTTITACAAGASGSIAAIMTTPVDVVKTRMMLSAFSDNPPSHQPGSHATAAPETRAKSTGMETARQILAENGVKGLFRGAALRAVWTAFGSGLYLGVYESARIYLGERRSANEISL